MDNQSKDKNKYDEKKKEDKKNNYKSYKVETKYYYKPSFKYVDYNKYDRNHCDDSSEYNHSKCSYDSSSYNHSSSHHYDDSDDSD